MGIFVLPRSTHVAHHCGQPQQINAVRKLLSDVSYIQATVTVCCVTVVDDRGVTFCRLLCEKVKTMASGGDKVSRGLEMKDRHPRFQVNRVATVDEDADEEELAELYDEEDDSPGSYVKSFRHFTREALPRMDNYRNIMSIQAAYRPTLDELHQATLHGKVKQFYRLCFYLHVQY